MIHFRKLPSLPTEGSSPVVAFPPEWAEEKAEGLIVEFAEEDGGSWIGNFRKGSTKRLSHATHHPNGREAVVVADGAMWIVDPQKRTAEPGWPDADQTWLVLDPERLVVSDGRSFLCLDAKGERWRTRPLSERAGFDALRQEGERLLGRAWVVKTQQWAPFHVDLRSGAVYDGHGPTQRQFGISPPTGPQNDEALSPKGERQLAVTRNLRRAGCLSFLALPLTLVVLRVLNELTGGSFRYFVDGSPWTHVFWSALFCLMMVGVLLALLTVTRACPRCQNGFFVTKGYRRDGGRGTVNIFGSRCQNCQLPLKGA